MPERKEAFVNNPDFKNLTKLGNTNPNIFSNPDSSALNNSKLRENNWVMSSKKSMS